MDLSRFFIEAPYLRGGNFILIFFAGLISVFQCHSEYPEVAVQSHIVVSRRIAGANPKTMAEMVATPCAEEIKGTRTCSTCFAKRASDGNPTLHG